MLHVTLSQTKFDFERNEVEKTVTTSFFVGPAGVIGVELGEVPDLQILDPDTGKQISLDDQPERWAALLPSAYRSGDISVVTQSVAADRPENSGGVAHSSEEALAEVAELAAA